MKRKPQVQGGSLCLHYLTFQHYIVFIFSLYIMTKVLSARVSFLITLGESTPRDYF